MYRLEYRSHKGGAWWTGHKGMEIKGIEDYVRKVNAPGASLLELRAIDLDTGEIIGDATPCSLCNEAHPGPDGSCLL